MSHLQYSINSLKNHYHNNQKIFKGKTTFLQLNGFIQNNNNIRYPRMNLNLVCCNPNNKNLMDNINNNT